MWILVAVDSSLSSQGGATRRAEVAEGDDRVVAPVGVKVRG
jgi:hypothetical protein